MREPPVDPLALSYYRYAWAVSDLGAVTRRATVEAFMGLFRSGNIVALAFASGDVAASPDTGEPWPMYLLRGRRSYHGSRKMSCVPMRRQMMCGSPSGTGSP